MTRARLTKFYYIVACLAPMLCHFYRLEAEDRFSPLIFVDTYSATSTNLPLDQRRSYLTQPRYNDGYNLNLVALGGAYEDDFLRAKLVGQYGDSVEANYGSEPLESFRYLQEGYLGFKISNDSYLDVGTFLSHLGAEGWLSKDNLNYTRSLIAEFSPYYETGVRFSQKLNQEWSLQILGLNGWQNTTDNRHPALGTQIGYSEDQLSVAYNTFLGEEDYGVRSFHDLVITNSLNNGLTLVGSLDVGWQSEGTIEQGSWWGYSLMAKQRLNEALALNARVESYFDPKGIIVTSVTGEDFTAHSVSLGLDISLGAGITLRGELRRFISDNKIFVDEEVPVAGDTIFVMSLSFWGEGLFR